MRPSCGDGLRLDLLDEDRDCSLGERALLLLESFSLLLSQLCPSLSFFPYKRSWIRCDIWPSSSNPKFRPIACKTSCICLCLCSSSGVSVTLSALWGDRDRERLSSLSLLCSDFSMDMECFFGLKDRRPDCGESSIWDPPLSLQWLVLCRSSWCLWASIEELGECGWSFEGVWDTILLSMATSTPLLSSSRKRWKPLVDFLCSGSAALFCERSFS